MPRLGIMQGRLSPMRDGRIQSFPEETWRGEFVLARDCGFAIMEWVLDSESNPLLSAGGRDEIARLEKETGVEVSAVCCDYFMEHPLQGEDSAPSRRMLGRVIEAAGDAGIRLVELPLIGRAGLAEAAAADRMLSALDEACPLADGRGVRLVLETDLPPPRLAAFLHRAGPGRVGVNYDSGNSAYWGFDPREEMALYGSRIENVHIKDCTRADYSVPLGRGEVDFDLTFDLLHRCGYRGDFILQAARGVDDCAVAREAAEFSRPLLARLKP